MIARQRNKLVHAWGSNTTTLCGRRRPQAQIGDFFAAGWNAVTCRACWDLWEERRRAGRVAG